MPVLLVTARIGGGVTCGSQKPAGEDCSGPNCGGFSGENDEHALRYLGSELRIPHLPYRGRIDQIDVAINQFCKSIFRSLLDVSS